jgi:hypothetical protein
MNDWQIPAQFYCAETKKRATMHYERGLGVGVGDDIGQGPNPTHNALQPE